MDFKEAIGHGIISGGAVLLFGLIGLLLRWIWLGIKSDMTAWHERKERKRTRLARASARREPPVLSSSC